MNVCAFDSYMQKVRFEYIELLDANTRLRGELELLRHNYAQLEKAAQQLVDSKGALQTALSNLGAGTK